jgi:hypothetical protein
VNLLFAKGKRSRQRNCLAKNTTPDLLASAAKTKSLNTKGTDLSMPKFLIDYNAFPNKQIKELLLSNQRPTSFDEILAHLYPHIKKMKLTQHKKSLRARLRYHVSIGLLSKNGDNYSINIGDFRFNDPEGVLRQSPKNGNGAKAVIATRIETGEETVYPSQMEAQRQLGITTCHISLVANGKRRQTKGYHFKFKSL